MMSKSGRYVIVFNGEIYNFRDLRKVVGSRGYQFRSESDTEVMLAVMEDQGVAAAVRGFAGMFAFAVVDRHARQLHLVRDRIGEKPLYYGWSADTLLFGSELKALRQYPGWSSEVNRDALALFLRFGYIPAPYSIYRGVFKVTPGVILTFPIGGARVEPTSYVYWSAREVAESGTSNPWRGDEHDLTNAFDECLRSTIRREMVADVPLGAFLSGGVDSSLVVALMQSEASQPVRTFTIGFEEPEYNEAQYARAVAAHLGTDHTEIVVRPSEALAVVPNLPTLYDEPFADPSQIPTFLVSRLARQHVTVALSGDGGDELFGGYDRYHLARRTWSVIGMVPARARAFLGSMIEKVPPARWDRMLQSVGLGAQDRITRRITGDRLHKLGRILGQSSSQAMYRDFMSHWRDAEAMTAASPLPTVLSEAGRWAEIDGTLGRMMYADLVMYLPDDILVKVDRASMGVSLEARAPFLDHSIVEFAWRIPQHQRVGNHRGKRLLRRLLSRYVPDAIVDRPKMGFGVPIDHWLRGPLKDWAYALIEPARLQREGYIDPLPVAAKWSEHQEGSRNWHYLLWDVLMFQAWLEKQ